MTQNNWHRLSLIEQMANIGSEVGRAINWKEKSFKDAKLAYYRALDLWELTLNDPKNLGRLQEVNRAKEMFGDWFLDINQYRSTAEEWQKYFLQFNYAARINR